MALNVARPWHGSKGAKSQPARMQSGLLLTNRADAWRERFLFLFLSFCFVGDDGGGVGGGVVVVARCP